MPDQNPYDDYAPSDFANISVDYDPVTGTYRPQGRGSGLPAGGPLPGHVSQDLNAVNRTVDGITHSPAMAGWDQLRQQFTSPQGIAGLAALVPMFAGLRGGSGNPFSGMSEADLMEEIRRSLSMQRGRMEQAQPVYDNLVRMATNAAPNANYGGPAYTYTGPQFGGR